MKISPKTVIIPPMAPRPTARQPEGRLMKRNSALKLISPDDLDGRLSCFGEFNPGDEICLKSCALALNCAIAKNKFLGCQLMDDGGLFQLHDTIDTD